MKNIIRGININIDRANYSPVATVKQEDNITLELNLYRSGAEFDITGQTVTLAAKRSDKVIIEQIDGFIINNNTLTINLKNNIIAKIGLVYLELIFTDEAGSMTTLDFYLKVNGKILGEDSLDASNNIASLEKIQQDFINSSNALLEAASENENTRVQAEKIRKNDEETRNRSETSRTNAETKRVEAEKTRVNQESLRVAAEEERVAAERIRDEKVEEISSQCTENTKEIDDAKGKYDTLETRLDKENEKIYDTINQGSFLPFEGQNVTVEHSKVGFTKDLKVEGRTLQNLWNKRKEAGEQTVFDLKPNTDYTYIIKNLTTGIQINYRYVLTDGTTTPQSKAIDANSPIGTTFLSKVNSSNLRSICFLSVGNVKADYEAIILEGDYTDKEIPEYFEDIKSVGEKEGKISILSSGKNLNSSSNEKGGLNGGDGTTNNGLVNFIRSKDFIKVHPNMNIIISGGYPAIFEYDSDFKFIKFTSNTKIVTTPSTKFIKYHIESTNLDLKILIEEGTQSSSHEPYKQDKKEILLPFEYGHKGFINGAKDMLEIRQDGLYAVQKVGRKVFNGTDEGTWNEASKTGTTRRFYLNPFTDKKQGVNNNLICDKLPTTLNYSDESIGVAGYDTDGRIYIKLSETVVETTINDYLKNNNMIVYYELAEPIETKIADLNSINLETFKDVTHVFSENAIAPNLSFKAPVDVPATLSSLRSANTILMAQNTELQAKNEQLEEVNKKQTTKIIELDDTTSFLIEDALTRKLNN